MSLMDLFKSKGSASPSSGSQRGDWKDWFLDIKGRGPFGKSVKPNPDSERGDWIDWYLNREGPAGQFNREKDENDWLDYNPYMLFNGGGSVRRDRPPSNIGRDRMGGSYNPRRDPTPNTMGLMQGDLRDTHHYPEGPLGITGNYNQNILNDFNDNVPGKGRLFGVPGGGRDSVGKGSYWNAALRGGMNRPDLEGIMQMAYRPGAYGTDYDYDDYGPFIPPSVIEMDEFGGEYDPVDDEYMFDLLRGNLTSIGQGIG